ncbi:hypothetical protein C8J56DRAFT_912673 [Mycena floridula]|nr:hypothetical protein C8J56DRAFT_912673 [Mycena floridula]
MDYPVIQDVVAGRRPQRTSGLFSDDIWAMVEACWSHQPSDRPSAAMVARALQHPSSQTTLWDRPTVAEGSKFQVQNGAPASETSSVSSGRSEAVESNERPADDIAPSVTPVVPGNEKGKISLAVQSGDVFQTSRDFTPPALPDRGIQTERFKEKQPIHAVANTPPEAIQTERFKEKQPIHATDLNAWTPISPMVPGNEKEKLSIVIPSQDTPNPSRNFTAPDPIGLGTQTERFKEKQRQDWRLPSPAESIVADPYGTLIAPNRSREESIARVHGYLRDQQSPGRSHGTQAWQVLQDLEVPEPLQVQSQSTSPISSRRFGFNLKFNWRRPKNELEPDAELIRMITYLVSTSCEDWNIVLKLCERCCVSDLNAKTAAESLAIELKQADLSSQLSTAKLWALMLHNSSETFSSQCMSRKFIDTLKDILLSQRTPRALRELLMKVLSDAAYTASVGNRRENAFRTLWRKVKAPGEPEEGVPLQPDDLRLFSNSTMTSPVSPTVDAIPELEHEPPRADEKTTVERPRVTSSSSEWSVKGVAGGSSLHQLRPRRLPQDTIDQLVELVAQRLNNRSLGIPGLEVSSDAPPPSYYSYH